MRFNFFTTFWEWAKRRLNEQNDFEQYRGIPQNIQQWENITEYNPLAIVNEKLTSKACDEATFGIESDSTRAEPMKELAKDLENKRYEICSMMNGKGGCFVTMAHDMNGEPYHIIIPPQDVSVYSIENNKITELAMIIDKKRYKKQWYNLVRHHVLDKYGTLSVYYYVTDDSGSEKNLPEWEEYKDKSVAYINANHIGVGYFKSPQNSRGLSPVFGVPLNFGCEDTEQQIIADRKALIKEMKNAEMKLFADRSIARMEKTKDGNAYNVPEDIYLIQKKAGIDGTLIDSFAPATRFADYLEKLEKSYEDYENQIGLNKGFLSRSETTSNATATEIKTANSQTISYIKKIQASMASSIVETLLADGVFMNVPKELYTVHIDWFDTYEDYNEQYNRIAQAAKDGFAEKTDVMQWLFPNLTRDELDEKLQRITEEKKASLVEFNFANMDGMQADAQQPDKPQEDKPNDGEPKEDGEDTRKRKGGDDK